MKTICLIHGVGFFKDMKAEDITKFAADLSKTTGAVCIVSKWTHTGTFPDDKRDSLLFRRLRNWVYEALMDYSYALLHAADIDALVPPADMYVGHSAGGIIAATLHTAPTVLLGTPLQLIRNLRLGAKNCDILNLMHYRDPIAAAVEGVTNEVIREPLILPYINPVAAHTGYWTSKAVLKRVTEWYKLKVGVEPCQTT
jgi:hypothetical protein